MVFAAGNDIRHVPKGGNYHEHVRYANAVAQPRFFAAARDAGIRQVVNIGSFYPHVAPQLTATNPYMRSRQAAHEGMRSLMSDRFRVISIDAPFVVGAVPGLKTMFETYVRYAQGGLGELPIFAPPGGVNFISTASLSDAVEHALPDVALPWGRGRNLFFEPDAADVALLAYRRTDVLRTIRADVVPQFRQG